MVRDESDAKYMLPEFSDSTRLRRKKRERSSSHVEMEPKKHCRITGRVEAAQVPRMEQSVGTFRQPRHRRPALPADFSTVARASASRPFSMNAMPSPKASGRSIPSRLAEARKNSGGIGRSKPAPSPL